MHVLVYKKRTGGLSCELFATIDGLPNDGADEFIAHVRKHGGISLSWKQSLIDLSEPGYTSSTHSFLSIHNIESIVFCEDNKRVPLIMPSAFPAS